MDSELLDSVQEHIDAAYKPTSDISSDGINWALAQKNAHEHLDRFVGYDAVQKSIELFKNN